MRKPASKVPVKALPTLILLAHGSRARKTLEEMRVLAKLLRAKSPGLSVAFAFLELARPTLPQAVSAAARAGSREIRVLPLFLFTGKHAGDDIPALAAGLRTAHPKVRITLLPAIGQHPGFIDLLKRAAGR